MQPPVQLLSHSNRPHAYVPVYLQATASDIAEEIGLLLQERRVVTATHKTAVVVEKADSLCHVIKTHDYIFVPAGEDTVSRLNCNTLKLLLEVHLPTWQRRPCPVHPGRPSVAVRFP